MTEEYSRTKHLDYIAAGIDRMARNSFMCKGWTVAIMLAIFAFQSNTSNKLAILLASIAIIALWKLDAYYIRKKNLLRKLFDDVRLNDYTKNPYSMNCANFKVPCLVQTMCCIDEASFYVPIGVIAFYMTYLAYGI